MSCKITGTSPDYVVNCNTVYDLLYAANDKKDVNSTISRKISAMRGFYKYLQNKC